jgi:hypothetical protein
VAYSSVLLALTCLAVLREWHGFSNPCGSQSRVVTGKGVGSKFTTLEKPTPVPRVEGFAVRYIYIEIGSITVVVFNIYLQKLVNCSHKCF